MTDDNRSPTHKFRPRQPNIAFTQVQSSLAFPRYRFAEGRSLDEHVEENGMSMRWDEQRRPEDLCCCRANVEVMLVKAVMERVFRRSFWWLDVESGDGLDELGK